MISWLVCRLILFPRIALYYIFKYTYPNLLNKDLFISTGSQILFYQCCLLSILFIMHIYWYFIFIKIIYNKIFKKMDYNDGGFKQDKLNVKKMN